MPDNNNPGGSRNEGNAGDDQGEGQGLTFDTWITQQPEDVRNLLDGHTSGLKSALESERTARKDFEKKIKELSGKAEKGSELEKQLAEIAKANERVQSQADFYEQAHSAGIKNLKLAFMVASNDELIDGRGRVNFDEMKRRFPELFTTQTNAAGNAGAGTGGNGTGTGKSMNDFIRTAAGRK